MALTSMAGTGRHMVSSVHREALWLSESSWVHSFLAKGQAGGDSTAGPKARAISATPPCPLSPLLGVGEELARAQAGDGGPWQGLAQRMAILLRPC